MLAVAAAKAEAMEYGYRPVLPPGSSGRGWEYPDGDDGRRDPWRPPLGAGLRGSL
ncbi:hypothetical protein D3C83_156440 [compost metagenome]